MQRQHPWVFSGAILKTDEPLEEGELVRVYTHDGEFMGVGHFQIGSISVRILSFHDVPINANFLASSFKGGNGS